MREIKAARDDVKSREDEILNYLIDHSTNAGAKSFKLQNQNLSGPAERFIRSTLLHVQAMHNLRIVSHGTLQASHKL